MTFKQTSKRSKISSESEFKQPGIVKIRLPTPETVLDKMTYDMLTRALRLERVSKSAQLGS